MVKKASDWIASKAKWLIRLIPIIPIIIKILKSKIFWGVLFSFVVYATYAYYRKSPPLFDKLWKTVQDQYPLSFLRLDKKILLEKVLVSKKNTIKAAGEKYDVPPEVIAAVIVKEQITQSLPDELTIVDTLINDKQHSFGLGAVFSGTTREAWAKVDPVRAEELGINGSNFKISYKLIRNKQASIDTIAVVLNYYARKEYNTEDVSTLTLDQWKQAVGRYNAVTPDKQKEYSDKVFEYLDSVREILK
ncbi:MAG: hypothetical protein WB502_01450 [Thermoactinomyces sp.]